MNIKHKNFKYILLAVLSALLVLWSVITFHSPKLSDYPASTYICDKDGNPMRTILGAGDMRCKPIALSETGEWTAKALIAAEDKRFYHHGGVDFLAVTRAMGQNIYWRKIISGASTISTQVIRMSSPRKRTVGTKFIEAVSSVQMERSFSKDDILAQYLNRMPLGGNLVGIQAASRKYFGKDAANLSLGEASLLAGLPQAPSRFRPDRRLKRALKRREFVLERMETLGFISAAERLKAEQQTIDVKIHPDEFLAPHFCELVNVAREIFPSVQPTEITTTLDQDIQNIIKKTLSQHKEKLNQKSVFGGAIVVIEVATGAVVAMIGSPDYDDMQHARKVNCAVMPRSPGSTLKPFAYAMAMDRGEITSGKIVADVPLYFKDYTPQNFDYEFRGLVTVRQALVDSLNIPALSIVNQTGLDEFVEKLRGLGLNSLDQPALHYGLSVILGTGEVKLLNLVNAYACLARQGIYMPYHLISQKHNSPDGKISRTTLTRSSVPRSGIPENNQLFSVGTAWMISQILSGNERSMAVAGHSVEVTMPRIAWKTGTSSGCRDAWTVGYNPEYAIGVWLGNPDGSATDRLVGIEDAAPIVMDIFRRLYTDGSSPWYEQPDVVSTRKVCADSGCPISRHCKSSVEDYYIPGISDPAQCQVHRCGVNGETREVWPTAVQAFFNKKSGNGDKAVRIVKPQNGEIFVLSDDLSPTVQRIELKAIANEELCWFIDGSLIAKTDQPTSWQLQKGRHEIVCTYASGKSDSVNIVVE